MSIRSDGWIDGNLSTRMKIFGDACASIGASGELRSSLSVPFWLSSKIPVFHFPTAQQNFGISFFCYVASFLVEEEWGLEQFVLLMGSRLALTNSLQILFFTVNLQFGHSGRKVGTVV
jgi:hypothetical protein